MRKLRLYNESALTYHKRYLKIQKQKYQAIMPFLQQGPILDVGVGTGIGLSSLIGLSSVVGVDGSIEMLGVAMRRNGEWKHRSSLVCFVCAVAEALPFRAHCMPTVISITMLQNLADVRLGIEELTRVLQKDGTLAVTSLSRILPLQEIEALLKMNYTIIRRFEGLAEEDDGVLVKLS
ncbi:MAG: class I SAM-dependent methyltransferase [Candidatus Thorarchaeota archaeon]